MNYRKTNQTWGVLLLISFLVVACDLEIEETDAVIDDTSVGTVFSGITDVDGAISNIYNDITGQAGDQANLYAMTEVTTDELLVPTRGTDWGDNGVWRTLHAHTWSPTHNHVTTVWNDKNGAVLRASEILDPLTTGATPEQEAHAHFTRAYNMWIVMDFYGQVPFRNPSDGQDILPIVMSRAEAYDMIVSDLEAAIANLPDGNPAAATKNRGTKATARFFLAKLKLNANVYLGAYGSNDLQDVIDLVDEIEADGFALTGQGTYFDVFPGPNVANTDVIWSVDASVGNRMWNGLHYNQSHPDNGGGGWNGFTTLAEFYDKFEGPASNALGGGQEERRGYTQTLQSTNDTNHGFGFGFQVGQMYGWRDGQAVALTDRAGAPLAFTEELPGLVGNNEVTGIRLLKYSPVNGGFTSGVVMARFADAHLMRAEAMLRLGNTAGALAEVNELRAMRENTPPLTSLSEQELLDERARELYTEGWRRNDLIRFGQFSSSWEFKEAGDGHTDLFPIPANALLSNPNLTQNPGY